MGRKLDSATTKKIKTTPKTAKKIGRKIDQIAGIKFNSPEERQLAEIEMWLSPFEVGGLIDHPLLRLLNESTTDFEKFKKVSKDQNLLIVWQHLKHVEKFEPESKYKNAYINMERLKCILFQTNPWFRSRIGHEMWWYANYVNPDSYYILRWEDHYDPRKWYKPGEPRRPEHIPPSEHGGNTEGTGTSTQS